MFSSWGPKQKVYILELSLNYPVLMNTRYTHTHTHTHARIL